MRNVKEVCEVFEESLEATLARTTILTPSSTLIRRLHREALLDFHQSCALVPTKTALEAAPTAFVPIPAVYAVLDGPSWRYGEPDDEERNLMKFAAGMEEIRRVPLEPHERRMFPFADYMLQRGSLRVPVRSAPLRAADEKRMRRNRVSVQYIGISPNVALVIRHHLNQFGSDVCQFVRVCAFRSMDEPMMEALRQAWMEEIGYIPRGNRVHDPDLGAFRERWEAAHEWLATLEAPAAGQTLLQPAPTVTNGQLDGSNLTTGERNPVEKDLSDQRRSSLAKKKATTPQIETGDADPQEQTVIDARPEEHHRKVVSPFLQTVNDFPESAGASTLPLNMDTVEQVLSEIRPLLQKDGGDARVLSVDPEEATVTLQFCGACASCPALEDTVRFGVETVLQARFGENRIQKIVLVSSDASSGNAQETQRLVDACEAVLDDLRPSLFAQDAVVEIERVQGKVLHLCYQGPKAMLEEIQDTLIRQVEGIERVEVHAFN
jgi:Fe-S cluster biogenesis protein NfuA